MDQQVSNVDDLFEQRLAKLQALRARGIDPYRPERFDRTHLAAEILEHFDALAESAEPVAVCGRVVSMRVMGKAAFLHLLDASGRIQVYLKLDLIGAEQFALLEFLDIGDFLGVYGITFRTRTGGSPSRRIGSRSSPRRFAHSRLASEGRGAVVGLQDVEQRYRQLS